ncbi:flippase-like domain-containing protein, partial [bacterium]|nr:flippase-like domain-containing protein [bacterium]
LYFFLFVPIISVLTMLPISLNGIGIREGAFVFFFTKVGISSAQALSMSILTYTIVLLASLIGGLIYAARR